MIKPVLGSQLKYGHPLSKGLVGCWLMNEGTGSKVNDLSGNGNSMTAVNSPVWSSGKFGSAILLDNGSNQYLECAGAVLSAVPMTIVAWFNSDDTNLKQIIFSIGSSISGAHFIYLAASGNVAGDPIQLARRDGGTTNYAVTSTGYSVNKWHQAAAVLRAADDVSVFIDGGSEGTSITSITPILDWTSIGVSRNNSYFYYMSGLVDHVILFNRALSTSEIAQLHREPFAMFEYVPIELWAAATIGAPPVGNAGIMTPNTGFWGPTF